MSKCMIAIPGLSEAKSKDLWKKCSLCNGKSLLHVVLCTLERCWAKFLGHDLRCCVLVFHDVLSLTCSKKRPEGVLPWWNMMEPWPNGTSDHWNQLPCHLTTNFSIWGVSNTTCSHLTSWFTNWDDLGVAYSWTHKKVGITMEHKNNINQLSDAFNSSSIVLLKTQATLLLHRVDELRIKFDATPNPPFFLT